MSATIIALAKLLASILSAGLLYQGFSPSQHGALLTKIAGVIVSVCTIVAVLPDIHDLFTPAEASQTEQKFWEGVLKYREEHKNNQMDCAYLKKYPDGQFVVLAKAECPDKVVEPTPAPVKPIADAASAPTAEPAPAKEITPTPVATDEWQTIDRYQVKGGLVKDTETGLMWMRCSLGQNWDGSTCKGEAIKYKWNDAMKQENTYHEGYDDWRMPTYEELKTLVFCSSGKTQTTDNGYFVCDGEYTKPTIKTEAFLNTPQGDFWSSSLEAYDSSIVRLVNFNHGRPDISTKLDYSAIRLVRAGQ